MTDLSSPAQTQPDGRDKTALTDAQLLAQFVSQRDQSAFEQLVHRHGPMIFGVCHRILKNHHAAEDVLQDTFLTLAKNAHRMAQPEMLASWLHRVARHAAIKTNQAAANMERLEQQMIQNNNSASQSDPALQSLWAEVAPVIDAELGRLSDKLRAVIVLCDIEGLTRKDAAHRLHWPEATVSSRLLKARSLLASRLTHQGVVLTSATIGLLLPQNAATAAVPSSVVTSIMASAANVKPTATSTLLMKVSAVAKGVTQSFLFSNIGLLIEAAMVVIILAAVVIRTEKKAPPASGEQKLASPFSEIAAAYREHYSAIKTLKVEYEIGQKNLIDPEILWKYWAISPSPSSKIVTLVVADDKIHFKEVVREKSLGYVMQQIQKAHPDRFNGVVGDMQSHISYQEFLEQLPNAPLEDSEQIRVFDGVFFRQKQSGSIALYHISGKSEAQRTDLFRVFFDEMRFDVNAANLQRLPDIFLSGDWRVVAEHELFDGADCLVVESDKSIRLWLDAQAGFALRRQTAELPSKVDSVCQDLHRVTGNLWMPQCIVETMFGDNRMPADYRGKPCIEVRLTASIVEANQPEHSSYFKLIPPAGAFVLDETLKPLDSSGKPLPTVSTGAPPPAISYTQPADPADIAKVVNEAQIKAGLPKVDQPPVLKKPNIARWIIVANVTGVLLAAGYGCFALRRSAHR